MRAPQYASAHDYVYLLATFVAPKEAGVFSNCRGVHAFLDGAFKGKGTWSVLSGLAARLGPKVEMVIFNFWAAGRGRGPWDTASGIFYRALRKEINRT
eukprot:gene13577-11091_t